MTAGVRTRPDVIAYRAVPRGAGALGTVALVAIGVAVIALAAQVRVPLPFTPVPLSGQTFAVLLVGAAVGARLALATTAIYLLLGTIGLPIFTGGGSGAEHLTGATGGYLIGFAAAAWVTGRLAELRHDRRLVPAFVGMALASFVIYVFGAGWLMISLGYDLPTAAARGVAPFVIGDALKAILAAAILPVAWKVVGTMGEGD